MASRSQPSGLEPTARSSGLNPEPSAAFTPGPWITVYQDGYRTLVRTEDNSINVALTGVGPWAQAHRQQEEANARLIAAAPDLLRSLKNMCCALNAARDPEAAELFAVKIAKTHDAALAAIAKALGAATASPAVQSARPREEP
jgi:hypothetical protein